MMPAPTLRSRRLILRPWRDEDLEPFARINADARVMEHFPAPLSREESDAAVARIQEHFDARGFGLWAAQFAGAEQFIGFVGLAVPSFSAHFTPCVELGWRLDSAFWNRGLATEGAWACVDFAFGELGLPELVSFTVPGNRASRRVMEKLGMRRSPADDFEHPGLPPEHPLRPHVLYRLGRSE